jgi:GlpG protein
MRQIATLADGNAARVLADYLLTLKIETRLDEDPEGWVVWVCDEDRVDQARQVLDEFLRNPADPRYSASRRDAQSLRRQEAAAEAAYRRRQERLRARMQGLATGGRTVTLALVAISVIVAVLTNLGSTANLGKRNAVLPQLTIAKIQLLGAPDRDGRVPIKWDLVDDLTHGQVWRLVTPIFIHFGFVHLLFNMIMLLDFGGMVESRIGPWRYLAMVLILAVVSNLVQYYGGPFALNSWKRIFHPSPFFGGMSGVIYGLFGYVWMKSVYAPHQGMVIHPNSVTFLMVWFFVCLSGLFDRVIGNVANGAHAGGLVAGILIGYVPHWWRSLRKRDEPPPAP